MAERELVFNVGLFYDRLDRLRTEQGLRWIDVAAQSGVSATLFQRLKSGQRLSIDSLALLLAWSRLDPIEFLPLNHRKTDNLSLALTYLKADMPEELYLPLEVMIKATYKFFHKPRR